jgi:hypothetical protein
LSFRLQQNAADSPPRAGPRSGGSHFDRSARRSTSSSWLVVTARLALFRSPRAKDKQKAVEEFIELEVNPARVVALFGDVVGWERLSVKEEDWVEMFGGPKGAASSHDDGGSAPDDKGELGALALRSETSSGKTGL